MAAPEGTLGWPRARYSCVLPPAKEPPAGARAETCAEAGVPGAGALRTGSFTRPTSSRASSPTSTVLPKSARMSV